MSKHPKHASRRDGLADPGQRIYRSETVLDALYRRLRWLFDEFGGRIICCVSGGKDSTVIFHACLDVAREFDALPLKVLWIDQEVEWQGTADLVAEWMAHPDVDPIWLQVPHQLYNAATSVGDHWLRAWDPAEQDRWMRAQHELARTENIYGTTRFGKLFGAVVHHEYPHETACMISGVRCEESWVRFLGLTGQATYKGETWGCDHGGGKIAMYPIYDWSYLDVWKAIHDHGWAYNRLYDVQHQYGINVKEMRISNLHHETAVEWLFRVQEFEPETYERLTFRLPGMDMAGKLGADDYWVTELPFMFGSWREYRDYLLEHLVDDELRPVLARRFRVQERYKLDAVQEVRMYKAHLRAILVHDPEAVVLTNFRASLPKQALRPHLYPTEEPARVGAG